MMLMKNKPLAGALAAVLALAPTAALADRDHDRGEHRGNNNPFANIPVSSVDGSFTGTFNIIGFVTRTAQDGTPTGVDAVGLLSGTLRGQKVTNEFVSWPLAPTAAGFGPQQVTCNILNLVLGPLHLNLLGLVVDLNQVVLNITGATGAGNLLGNLLCGLFGALNIGATLATIEALVGNLNGILTGLGL